MALNFETNRTLSEFSTLGIGGPAQFFVTVTSLEAMQEAFAWALARHLPYRILGKGSNCLFSDASFQGLCILNQIHFLDQQDSLFHVGAGYSFARLGMQTARQGWEGLEFACGIPASVGGAVYMNAGANQQEVKHTLVSVEYLHETGLVETILPSPSSWGYRTSLFQTLKGAIVSARFSLKKNPSARSRQIEILRKRIQTQPLQEKSAGCIFRNPSPTLSAGALIEQCGLKGFSVGSAKVSEIHANFLINTEKASAEEMLLLIREIQTRVFEKTGIQLEPEVRIFS